MFEEKLKPANFPAWLSTDEDQYCISSEEHYVYLNEAANKLYQVVYGYKSCPDLDYFCSNHPHESGCFTTALVMDRWMLDHDFNNEKKGNNNE